LPGTSLKLRTSPRFQPILRNTCKSLIPTWWRWRTLGQRFSLHWTHWLAKGAKFSEICSMTDIFEGTSLAM
jgi:hypothetical protein